MTQIDRKAGRAATLMTVFIRDLVLTSRIGVYQHEKLASQRVRINVELTYPEPAQIDDDLENVVCYADLVTGIQHIVGGGHTNLVETLADRIAALCLADARIHRAKVRVEKLDVFPEAESVGVEIDRSSTIL